LNLSDGKDKTSIRGNQLIIATSLEDFESLHH